MVAVSLVVAVIALFVAVVAIRRADVVDKRARQRRVIEGQLGEATGSMDPGDSRVATPVEPGLDQVEVNRRLTALEHRRAGGISRIAVVRYDAFEDVGGQLSYSVALVDGRGRGLVLSAIHGRAETRTYVKQVPQPADSARTVDLSPEEREALREAAKQGSDGAQRK